MKNGPAHDDGAKGVEEQEKQTRTEMADGKLIVYRQSDITELSLVRVIELEKVVREASHFLYMVGALAVVLIVLSFALSLIFSTASSITGTGCTSAIRT